MATIYRALWDDPLESDQVAALGHSRRCFTDWAVADSGLALSGDGEWDVPISSPNGSSRKVTIRTVAGDGFAGFRASAHDEADHPGAPRTAWTTSLSVIADRDGMHTWVENALETDDVAQRIKIGRPRLVDALLSTPGKHLLGGSAVRTDVVPVSADGVPVLVDVLRGPDRALPVIAFSEPASPGMAWTDVAEKVARRAGGVATVVTLDQAAARALRALLGGLGVWGGAVRTYTLAPLDTAADGWRHRYYTLERLAESGPGVVDRLVYHAAQLSTRRRVPTVFSHFTQAASAEETRRLADAEEQWAFDLELEQEERKGVERELARALGHLGRLARSLEERDLSEVFWGTHDASADELPEDVQDVSEAVLAARTYLAEWLAIANGAERELDGIDAAPNAYAWGNTTMRGLRALAAYSKARSSGFDGGFWEWCERGEPNAWPATTKKLAMRESETVANNPRFVKARQFPIDVRVSPTGEQYMESHLKISEGGGDLAPRVYFHDDTSGPTAKVHVGFVGPHYLVPNTRS